jgi:uncharacterized protein YkwD
MKNILFSLLAISLLFGGIFVIPVNAATITATVSVDISEMTSSEIKKEIKALKKEYRKNIKTVRKDLRAQKKAKQITAKEYRSTYREQKKVLRKEYRNNLKTLKKVLREKKKEESSAAVSVSTNEDTYDAFRAEVLNITNNKRAVEGIGALTHNSLLQKAAQVHAENMAKKDFFEHVSPDGDTPVTRVKATGYLYRTMGENIAVGQDTSAEVMEGWENSPLHRENFMNIKFTQLGVGIAKNPTGNGYYWVQVFGTPRE